MGKLNDEEIAKVSDDALPIPEQVWESMPIADFFGTGILVNYFPLGKNQPQFVRSEGIKKIYIDAYRVQEEDDPLPQNPHDSIVVEFDNDGRVSSISPRNRNDPYGTLEFVYDANGLTTIRNNVPRCTRSFDFATMTYKGRKVVTLSGDFRAIYWEKASSTNVTNVDMKVNYSGDGRISHVIERSKVGGGNNWPTTTIRYDFTYQDGNYPDASTRTSVSGGLDWHNRYNPNSYVLSVVDRTYLQSRMLRNSQSGANMWSTIMDYKVANGSIISVSRNPTNENYTENYSLTWTDNSLTGVMKTLSVAPPYQKEGFNILSQNGQIR